MILVPLVAAFFSAALVAFRLSELREYNCYKLESVESAEGYINNYMLNVSYDAAQLKPAGYDYTVNNKKMGEYYYLYQNDQIWLFALKYSGIDKIRHGNTLINFRITTDQQLVEQVMNDLSDSFGTEEKNLNGFINPIVMNEFEYPFLKILLSKVFLYGSISLFAFFLIYLFLVFFFPSLGIGASKLKRLGKKREMIKILNEEMKDKLLYSEESVYVTENYLISALISEMDVVRLDDIKYLSKHVEEKKGIFSKHNIYKLTASNVEKLYFEHDFESEEVIDKVIYYIRREDLVDETEELERNMEDTD